MSHKKIRRVLDQKEIVICMSYLLKDYPAMLQRLNEITKD